MKKHELFQILMIASLVHHTYGFATSVISFAVWYAIAHYWTKND